MSSLKSKIIQKLLENESSKIHIKPGMKFEHKRILEVDSNGKSTGKNAICTVSKVANGVVYYKVGDEPKAKSYFDPNSEKNPVKKWL